MCYQALGDEAAARSDHPRHGRLHRHPAAGAAAGWGLQHTARPEAGRRAHLRAEGAGHAHDGQQRRTPDRFYELTGDTKYLRAHPRGASTGWSKSDARRQASRRRRARIRPSSSSARTSRSTCTARARTWSTAEYYVDKQPENTIVHYSSFRAVDIAKLRKRYETLKATPPRWPEDLPLKGKAAACPADATSPPSDISVSDLNVGAPHRRAP